MFLKKYIHPFINRYLFQSFSNSIIFETITKSNMSFPFTQCSLITCSFPNFMASSITAAKHIDSGANKYSKKITVLFRKLI